MDFKGTDCPEIYLIDFHQEEDENVSYPFQGPRGEFLVSLLGSFSLLDKVRMANMTVMGRDCVIEDLKRCSPKVIVPVGSEGLKEFVVTSRKISEVSGDVFDFKIDDTDFKLIPLVSPSYVLRRIEDSSTSLKFSQDIYKIFQVVNGEYVDILKDKTVLSAHSFDEFKKIYEKYFINDSEISYDIETNARPPLCHGGEIIGFSIANATAGVYVSHESLDFNMSKEETDKIWEFLINEGFEKKEKLIIHNTQYERPYTYYCKGYEIGYEKAHDTLVMARLLKGSKEGAGLKYQAQKNLHYPDWETNLSLYISGVRGLIERVGLGPKKYKELYEDITNTFQSIFNYKNYDTYKSLSTEDQEEISSIIDKVKGVLVDLYSEEEIKNLDTLILSKVKEAVQNGGILDSTIPYNWIPDKVICQYGAVDSLATYDLKEYFFKVMDEESTSTVDLHKGYEYWLEHMYVAYIMERNGMYWDDEVASRDREFLVDQATRCLKSMLLSPVFESHIIESCEGKYKPMILANYLPEIAESQGYSVTYDNLTGKYSVFYNGKRVRKDTLWSIEVPKEFVEPYKNFIVTMFKKDVTECDDYVKLTDFYNPSSSTESHIAKEILLSGPDLQMGGRIVQLHTLSESPEFEEIKDKIPAVDQKFLQVSDLLCSPKVLKSTYGDSWADWRKKIYQNFCNLYNTYKSNVTIKEIKEIVDNPKPVEIESLDDGGIIQVYNNLVVTGMDQDDTTTWTPQFEWMVNFRLFKKSNKLISSYIDGSVGRGSVAVVDKDTVQSGSHLVERKRDYDSDISDDECYLLKAKWSPNTAETGRWRSAQHTVPWGSQIKKYYGSRFVGGTTCCPDYSQMEVRTLAAISKDKNMLELFHSGKDFHTETAKKIYRKDEVTTAERRFSKTATFSLLYGAMETSFANNYCKGDMAYAHMVYGGFFEAYPEVKKWVDERHKEVQRDHRVSLELSNRFIKIEPEGEGKGALNSMLRKAQNYPIQAQSADLTGCVIFDLQKYIEENNLKSLVFMYVHDSIEVDIYPYELLQFINKLKTLLNESPMRRYGLPSHADVALGKSLGHEIELEEIEMNEDMTEGYLYLKGYKDEIDETVENWKKAYAVVEVSDENYEDDFVSMGELFILRKAYTPTLGTLRHKGTCKVHIKYFN